MRFVDLFAGLGGFHIALRGLGHDCVFACELDPTLRKLYFLNFGIEAEGDIRAIRASDIPSHEILCAGFPCQPFSKAGGQEGFGHPGLGRLYQELIRVVRHHKPAYLLLENVPHLQRHGNGRTWDRIEALLRREGYDVQIQKLSPHRYGVPQIRERVFIVGSRRSLDRFEWPQPQGNVGKLSIYTVLDTTPPDARPITEQVRNCLRVWQEFLDQVPREEKVPHPLWAMEFGATYPYTESTPYAMSVSQLRRFRGSFGRQLRFARSREELMRLLPSHARRYHDRFPQWKVAFIENNRAFYARHKTWVDRWKPKIMDFPSSFQKLEWNCQGEANRQLRDYVLQIRPSGVRVKRPTTAPSLVAMTDTQVPIIGWEDRYMTPTECKRLQSMEELQYLPESLGKAYEALGNAVNVKVARLVAEALIGKHRRGR